MNFSTYSSSNGCHYINVILYFSNIKKVKKKRKPKQERRKGRPRVHLREPVTLLLNRLLPFKIKLAQLGYQI